MLRESVLVDVTPFDLSVEKYFTLDKNSQIFNFFKKMCEQPENIQNDGEVNAKVDIIDINRHDLDNSEDENLESGDIGGSYYQANQISKKSYNIDNDYYEDELVSNNPNSSISKVGAPKKLNLVKKEGGDTLDVPVLNHQNSSASSGARQRSANTSIQKSDESDDEETSIIEPAGIPVENKNLQSNASILTENKAASNTTINHSAAKNSLSNTDAGYQAAQVKRLSKSTLDRQKNSMISN
jgi:hypothetical protein